MDRSSAARAREPSTLRVVAAVLSVATPVAWLIEPRALIPVALAVLLALIPAHAWSYGRCRRSTGSSDAVTRSTTFDTLALGGALLAHYVLLLGAAWHSLTRWPRVGSLIDIPVMLLWVGVLFQLLLFVSWVALRRLPRRRWPVRIAAVVGGLLVAGAFIAEANTPALARLRSRSAHLLRELDASPASEACETYRRHLGRRDDQGGRPRSLHAGGGRWVLTFFGGSADPDGSTIVLDSAEEQPRVFHNDTHSEQARLKKIQAGLTPCDAEGENDGESGAPVN